jgi:hypothetical protein
LLEEATSNLDLAHRAHPMGDARVQALLGHTIATTRSPQVAAKLRVAQDGAEIGALVIADKG